MNKGNQLLETIEREYNFYRMLAECGEREGLCTDAEADLAHEVSEKLIQLQNKKSLTTAEVDYIEEVALKHKNRRSK